MVLKYLQSVFFTIFDLASEKTFFTTIIINLLTNSTMEKIIAQIKEQIAAIEKDIDKVDNKAARARVRKATLALEKIGKEYRKASI